MSEHPRPGKNNQQNQIEQGLVRYLKYYPGSFMPFAQAYNSPEQDEACFLSRDAGFGRAPSARKLRVFESIELSGRNGAQGRN
jgi:hypothetical protein